MYICWILIIFASVHWLMRWLTFNTFLPREWWLPKRLISTWQGHLNIMHSLVPNYEYWESWKQSTPIQTMAAEMTAWLFTITIHLCVLPLFALPSQSQLAPKFYWVVVSKGQRKEFWHKIKSRNVTLTILLSRFCFHFCCDFFCFHTFTTKILFF